MSCAYIKPHPYPDCQSDWWVCGRGYTRLRGEPSLIRHGDVANPMNDLDLCGECEKYQEGDLDETEGDR